MLFLIKVKIKFSFLVLFSLLSCEKEVELEPKNIANNYKVINLFTNSIYLKSNIKERLKLTKK
jgi:predicted ABC-type exoprotein transport system permease subunit